jgi:hypothetical protein
VSPGGPTRLVFESFGAVVAVEPEDAALLDLVRPLLPAANAAAPQERADASYVWNRTRTPRGRRVHVVAVLGAPGESAVQLARTRDARRAAGHLAHDAEFRVAMHARGGLFVHAAAVAWNGRGIVVPGRSRAGKSELAAALVRAGATYLSDEYAVLDDAGLLHPFPRRLRLRRTAVAPARTVAAHELGGTTAAGPVPVGLIVSTTYRRGASWRPARMSCGECALALLGNAVIARLRPGHALRVIARTLDGATGLRGTRGEAHATAAAILAHADACADACADAPPRPVP